MRHIILFACILFFFTADSSARTWQVPAEIPTIGEALNSAASGDLVEVAAGIYPENGLVLRPGVSLRGATGNPADVKIDGSDAACILSAVNLDQSSKIDGITFRNGHGIYGGAINLDSSSPTITNCDFRSNYAEYGGAMYCAYSSPELSGCTFAHNSAYGDGGISFFGQSQPSIENCLFKDNESYEGAGAVWSIYSVGLDVRGCEFLRNSSVEYAGALVSLELTNLTVENCVFTENHSEFSAGGAVYMGANGTLTDCRFFGNDAPRGGALSLSDYGNTVTDCLFVGNWSQWHGGAIWFGSQYAGPQLVGSLVGCTLYGNTAPDGDGVVAATYGATVLIENSLLTDGLGGGSVFIDPESSITVTCSNIFSNVGGDWIGRITDQLGTDGNISLDPLYCDVTGLNFSVDADSPCLPANNECGELIGARGLGCGDTPVHPESVPSHVQLLPNHPNPFNPSTTIRFGLAGESRVRLSVLSADGHVVTTLLDEQRGAGWHEQMWNGCDRRGRPVASGIYFYRLDTDGQSASGCMTLIK